MKSYYSAWYDHLNFDSKTNLSELGLDETTLELYRDFIHNHWKGAVKKMFPRLAEIKEIDWNTVYEDYYKAYPPKALDLNEMSYQFPEFLKSQNYPDYLVELALYEVLEFKVYIDTNKFVPSTEALTLNPTCHLQLFQNDIASWVKKLDRNEKVTTPEIIQNILCVVRHPETYLNQFRKLNQIELAIIEIIKQIPISREDFVSELSQGLSEFGIEANENEIQNSLNSLQEQSIIA